MHDQKNGKGKGQREELTRRRVVLGQVPLCEKCAVLPQVHEEVRNHLTQVCLYIPEHEVLPGALTAGVRGAVHPAPMLIH